MTVSNPEAVSSTAPANGGARSYQTVLPKLTPLHVNGSGSPPPSGCPSRLGLKRSGCVVASVRSALAENVVELSTTAVEAR
jgi:hypothetical protein